MEPTQPTETTKYLFLFLAFIMPRKSKATITRRERKVLTRGLNAQAESDRVEKESEELLEELINILRTFPPRHRPVKQYLEMPRYLVLPHFDNSTFPGLFFFCLSCHVSNRFDSLLQYLKSPTTPSPDLLSSGRLVLPSNILFADNVRTSRIAHNKQIYP